MKRAAAMWALTLVVGCSPPPNPPLEIEQSTSEMPVIDFAVWPVAKDRPHRVEMPIAQMCEPPTPDE